MVAVHISDFDFQEGGLMRKEKRGIPIGFVVAVPVVFLIGVAVFLSAPRVSAAQETGYAGTEQCAACHDNTAKAFKDSIHAKKGFEQRSRHGCETCHGPGQAHVEAGGGKGTMTTPASLPKAERSHMCLQCHEQGTKMFWPGSAHDSRGLACQDCHSVHGAQSDKAQLKTADESELCFGCHTQKRGQFFRSSHHPIREGKIACSDCHNPHGTQSAKLINADSVNEQCYKCHAEKRGPFLWEHIPVREECTTCHEPHGSNHPKLMNAKEPFLCQRCHSDTRHPGTLYDQSQVSKLSNKILNRSCTNCHSAIHGSNHPSGERLMR
jgi:DmsE family decaheme c-type cytochrome